jgi:hypothetical protein
VLFCVVPSPCFLFDTFPCLDLLLARRCCLPCVEVMGQTPSTEPPILPDPQERLLQAYVNRQPRPSSSSTTVEAKKETDAAAASVHLMGNGELKGFIAGSGHQCSFGSGIGGMVIDNNPSNHYLYVTLPDQHIIVRVRLNNEPPIMEVYAGSVAESRHRNGIGLDASFIRPTGISRSMYTGDLYVCDESASVIRHIDATCQFSFISAPDHIALTLLYISLYLFSRICKHVRRFW